MAKLMTVKLLGEAGRLFGREFKLMVRTPQDAIRGISANRPGFFEYLRESEDNGIVWRVVLDTGEPEGIEADQLDWPVGDCLIIAPIAVARGAWGRIIVGAILVVASFFMPATIGILGMYISSLAVGLLGASLILGGVFQLLSPIPKLPAPIRRATPVSPTKRRTEGRNKISRPGSDSKGLGDTDSGGSFLFDSAADIGNQGMPYPILYGRRIIANPIVMSTSLELNTIVTYNYFSPPEQWDRNV